MRPPTARTSTTRTLFAAASMNLTPEHHSDRLIAHQESPWNAEPDVRELIKYTYTPEELVYCRNHCKSVHIRFDL